MPELHLLSPSGFRAAGVHAGIKSKQTPDVGLLIADALFDEIPRVVDALAQIQVPTVALGLFDGLKLRGHTPSPELADFLWLS